MIGMGLTNEYMAFIPNQFSNSVSVYESAGGGVVFENLPEGRMIAPRSAGFLGPARGTWNWQTYINITLASMAQAASSRTRSGRASTSSTCTNFTLSPPPGFPGPAGTRESSRKARSFSAFTNPSDVEHRQHVGSATT